MAAGDLHITVTFDAPDSAKPSAGSPAPRPSAGTPAPRPTIGG